MNRLVNHFIKYQFPAFLWAILIFVASSIPATKFPDLKIFTYDKVLHISIFFIFGLLVYRAFERRSKSPSSRLWRIIIAALIVIFYGILDEVHQGTVPGRTFDVWDMTADAVGGILSSLITYWHLKYKRLPVIS